MQGFLFLEELGHYQEVINLATKARAYFKIDQPLIN
jgi:hypothetical protein